ncbi:unnamed protein product [Diamesa tonsa]
MLKWQSKIAVITGANSGNGLSILKKLAENGLVAVGLDLKTDQIDKLATENKQIKISSHVCDVTKNESVMTAFKFVDTLGGVDVLVNSAGIGGSSGLLDYNKPLTDVSKIIDVNLTGVISCTQQAFKSMNTRDAYGYIVNINSILGHKIPKLKKMHYSSYPATKFAITALTETVQQELANMKNGKVRVTSLSPGFVKTNIFESSGMPKEHVAALYKAEPTLTADDIADAVIYLLSTPYTVNVTELSIQATARDSPKK